MVLLSVRREHPQDNLVPPDRRVANHKIPGLPRNILQIGQLIYLKIPNPQKVALLI
jgi:hypothetical protein